MQASGGDDGSGCGLDLGPPFERKHPVTLRKITTGAGRALAGMVGIGHIAAGDETKQVVAVAAHHLEQAA
jgi:hypothetical protein